MCVVMLSVVMLNVIVLSVIMLSVIMLSVFMLCVAMLSVYAECCGASSEVHISLISCSEQSHFICCCCCCLFNENCDTKMEDRSATTFRRMTLGKTTFIPSIKMLYSFS